MIGNMAIAVALPGYNDLGRSVTPNFLSRKRFYSQLSPHCPKMNKKSMWEIKKIQDFCPRDIEYCHLSAARRVNLWSLNTNLFFKEPHQLTNFTQQVYLNNILQRTFHFKGSIVLFLGLLTLLPYSLTIFQIQGDLSGLFSPKRSR